MSFQELIRERFSARSYEPRPVEQEKVDTILEAARVAPTAANKQPRRIRVVRDPAELAKIDECTRSRNGAPLVFLVCWDTEVAWQRQQDGARSGEVDAGIVTTHMMLQAQELGLGTVWVMAFDPVKLRDLFAIPDNLVPIALLPAGYITADCKPSPRHTERLPVSDLLF